jgi:hypothetical protein
MKRLYCFNSREGVIYIVTNGTRFLPEFEGDYYGSYDSIPQLISELRAGNTLYFPGDLDTSQMDLPADLSAWQRCAAGPCIAGQK